MELRSFHQIPETNCDDPNCVNIMIRLDRNGEVHYAGQYLKGTIELEVKKKILIQDISVTINGITEIAWHDKDITKHRKDLVKLYYNNTYHHDQRDIYSRRVLLISNTEVQPSKEKMEIPFEIFIHQDCVSSCSFEFGFVQYELKVSCRTYQGTRDYKQSVKVIRLSNYQVERPFSEIKGKKNFQLQTTLPKRYFQPGERVDIQTKILMFTNDEQIDKLSIQLVQFITYRHHCIMYGRNGVPYDSIAYVNQKRHLVEANIPLSPKHVEQEVFYGIALPADLTPSNHLNLLSILSIHYEVHILLLKDMDNIYLNQEIPIEITHMHSNENGVELEPLEQHECCEIYKRSRLMWVWDNLFK